MLCLQVKIDSKVSSVFKGFIRMRVHVRSRTWDVDVRRWLAWSSMTSFPVIQAELHLWS